MESVATSPSWAVNAPGSCEHKARTGCMLSALPGCCSCADKRPQAAAYPIYIDGQGMRLKGRRWQRYCRRCFDFWQSLATDRARVVPETPITTAPLSNLPSTTEMPPTRRSMRGFGRSYVSEFNPADNVNFNVTSNPLRSNPTQPARPPQEVTQNARNRRQRNATDHGHPEERRRREYAFPLGTREDVQQEDYVSPIFGLFNRAWTRYRDAEEERTAVQSAAAAQEGSRLDNEDYQVITHHSSGSREISLQHVRQENVRPDNVLSRALARQHLLDASPLTMETMLRAGEAQMDRGMAQASIANGIQEAQPARRAYTDDNPATRHRDPPHPGYADGNVPASGQTLAGQPILRAGRRGRNYFHTQFYSNPFDEREFRYHNDGQVIRFADDDPFDRINPIDAQRSRRPAPTKSEDLNVNFACKICQEQKIDSICMPCMHAATCRWCAEIFKDQCRDANGRFDHRLWNCVICRKQIKEVKRFFI